MKLSEPDKAFVHKYLMEFGAPSKEEANVVILDAERGDLYAKLMIGLALQHLATAPRKDACPVNP